MIGLLLRGAPRNDNLRGAALLFVIVLFACASLARAADPAPAASSSPALDAVVTNTRDDKGRVGCNLFNDSDPSAFPRDSKKKLLHVWAPIRNGSAVCEFSGIPAGTYAVVVFQDEDMSGGMRSNMLGMPLEGYGFSNNPRVRFSAPSFGDASFKYNGQNQKVSIVLQYWSP